MLITSYAFESLAVILVLLTLPLVLELAMLTLASRFPRRRAAQTPGGAPIQLAVIIPAHNEEVLIASCVESLRVSAANCANSGFASGIRIIAVAHNCNDRTAQRAGQAGAEVVVYNDPEARGKGRALTFGFSHAAGLGCDAILVVDADSTVSANLVGAVCEAIGNGAGGVQCRYEIDSSSKRPTTRLTSLAFRGFNVVRPAGRQRLGLSAGLMGNGFAIRQSVLAQNPYNSLSVVEDLEFHIKLVLAGEKIEFLEEARVCAGMPASKAGDAAQRSRWEGGRAYAAVTWFLPLVKQLAGGRLRVLEPALELACLPIGYAAFLLVLAACLPLEWVRIYALVSALVIAGHVLAAAWSGSDFAGDLRILARAPGYIMWKLLMLPSLLRSSHAAAVWVPTDRPAAAQVGLTNETEGLPVNAMEHVLQISGSMETL